MDLFSSFSDDQVALIGCAVAFVVTGVMLSISYHLGGHKQRENQQQAARERILTTARRNAESMNKAA